ncbi:4873_t:CDS:2 [Paraglomus occultum]|uniref:4873_t:CDS:1 n=1 Tax=Paraglomus occultum TaxID=144539 RepID=A0A9N8ZQH5_9GLOM|nr:4873_t:CDS:2 [Paraglomus occultum]
MPNQFNLIIAVYTNTAYIVNASSEALFTTSNFGAYIAGAGKPNSPCTGGVISQVLSSTDLQQFLDPTAVNYNVTLPYSSCSDCVQTCNQTKPQVPLDTWCLVVSNPNKVNGIYASVKIESSAPATTTTSSPTSTHNAGLRLSSQFQIPFLQITTVDAQSLSGNIFLSPVQAWYTCNQASYLTFIVNATNQPLTTTANFGTIANRATFPLYQVACPTGALIAQVLSPSDLQVSLIQIQPDITILYRLCHVCDLTHPTTPPPLGNWCLVVSNGNYVDSVYASIQIGLSGPIEPTTTSTTTSTISSSTSATSTPNTITTVVVNVPISCR